MNHKRNKSRCCVCKAFENLCRRIAGLFCPVKQKPQVQIFLKGQSMTGQNLIYTAARPALTAPDIKEVHYFFYIGEHYVGQKTTDKDIEAVDFKVKKGTKDVKVGVAFCDTSDLMGETTFSPVFDAIDTIAPPAPAEISITVREETDADVDVYEVHYEAPAETEPKPEEGNETEDEESAEEVVDEDLEADDAVNQDEESENIDEENAAEETE